VADYLNAQIEAGAQAVMIFDSWGGVLADGAFQRFSLAYTARVLERLRKERDGRPVPRIVFTKGGGPWLEAIAGLDAQVVGIDWTLDLAAARRRVGSRVALQGNLDPAVLFAPPEAIELEVERSLASLASTGSLDGHVFNLGHGINQHTPPDHVAALVESVHRVSTELRLPART
jgi:uroporphyrinogen decarboxylase